MAETWIVFSQEVKWFSLVASITTDILPLVDYAVDFHAGGASRFNALKLDSHQTIQN
jgi:hypothetical protein